MCSAASSGTEPPTGLADDDGQLELVVELLGESLGVHDRIVRADDRVDVLEEHDALVHRMRPVDRLQLVVVVDEVARRVEELLGHDRRPQADVGEGESFSGFGRRDRRARTTRGSSRSRARSPRRPRSDRRDRRRTSPASSVAPFHFTKAAFDFNDCQHDLSRRLCHWVARRGTPGVAAPTSRSSRRGSAARTVPPRRAVRPPLRTSRRPRRRPGRATARGGRGAGRPDLSRSGRRRGRRRRRIACSSSSVSPAARPTASWAYCSNADRQWAATTRMAISRARSLSDVE